MRSIKNSILIIFFLNVLTSFFLASFSFGAMHEILINYENKFEKNSDDLSIDKLFILEGSKYLDKRHLLISNGHVLIINTEDSNTFLGGCKIKTSDFNFKSYESFINHKIIKIEQHQNTLFLLSLTQLVKIDIDDCFTKKKIFKAEGEGEVLDYMNKVTSWGFGNLKGFFCDMLKTKNYLLTLKCNGVVTSYNLTSGEVEVSGRVVSPTTTVQWSSGATTPGPNPEIRLGLLNDKVLLYGEYSQSNHVYDTNLIINEVDINSLNVINKNVYKCDYYASRPNPVQILRLNDKITVFDGSEFRYTPIQISNSKCFLLNKRKFWKNSYTEYRTRQRGLFFGKYFFDGQIKNSETEKIHRIGSIEKIFPDPRKARCGPRGFHISSDGTAIVACKNQIVIVKGFIENNQIEKIKKKIIKTWDSLKNITNSYIKWITNKNI